MRKVGFVAVAIAIAGVLAACGGGGDGDSKFKDPGSTGGSGGNGGGAGADNGSNTTVSLGSPAGPSFNPGTMGITSASLSAGGSTGLQVVLQQSDGVLYTESTSVTFNSPCIAQGKATVTSPVVTTTGIASTTYVASGCSGSDVVTATANIGGKQLSATGTINVSPGSIGSIAFVSATPTQIALQGTGGAGRQETSTVIFEVKDSSGGPRADADVTFSLDTNVGGITLTPTTAKSDAQGRVQTIVNAGTIHTTATVTAKIASPAISTQSSQLTISSGLPDADSFSLAVQCNNVEAWNYDGVVVPVTARLSDRFNNPPPDGTAVTFTAEGGSILSECPGGTVATASEGGVCATNWRSSAPKPTDGRVTLLATATGEESFNDVNGDGVFTSVDLFDADPQQPQDLGEPFRDDNEDGVRQSNEPFLDFYNQGADLGVWNGPDGKFNGLLCQDSARCDAAKKTAGIGASNLIIMSGSTPVVTVYDSSMNPIGGTISVPAKTSKTFYFHVRDARGNVMPAKTTVSLGVAGTGWSVLQPNTFEVPCTGQKANLMVSGTTLFAFTISGADTVGPANGTFTLTVATKGPGINNIAGTTTLSTGALTP
ncbi:MAG TPA: hypothetical protein VG994_00150 [Steroidobacteraceae bacterium]|nr:hypothetical protein [Steroidobacteraceae bacterium]